MVSNAIESARARTLGSPAPPHARAPPTKAQAKAQAKAAPEARTAAQRRAQLQAQIRAVRAEKATIAEELGKVRAKAEGGRAERRKLAAESLERGRHGGKKLARGGGALLAL